MQLPDPPILASFDFLAFFVFRFSLLFCAFFPFSRDFRGSAKRKTLAFLGKNPCFFQKARIGGSGLFVCSKPSLEFVKEFLRFSVSRPGHWEDNNTIRNSFAPYRGPFLILGISAPVRGKRIPNNTKNHEERPQESPRTTDSDQSATNSD